MDPFPLEVWTKIASNVLDEVPPPQSLPFDGCSVLMRPAIHGRNNNMFLLSSSMGRACRFFYDVVSPLTWRHICVASSGELHRLAVLAVQGPSHNHTLRLATFIRRLDVDLHNEVQYDEASLVLLLHEAERLESLVLAIHPPRRVDQPQFRIMSDDLFMGIGQCKRLQEIVMLDELEVPTIRGLVHLSKACPRLRRLQLASIACQSIQETSSLIPTTLTISFSCLEVLVLGNGLSFWDEGASGLYAFLRLLGGHLGAMPHFRSLHILHPITDDQSVLHMVSTRLQTVLLRGRTLRSLQPPSQYRGLQTLIVDVRHQTGLPSIPTELPALHTIRFRQMPMRGIVMYFSDVQRRTVQALDNLADHLPWSLEVVELYVPSRPQSSVQPFLRFTEQYGRRGLDFVIHAYPVPYLWEEEHWWPVIHVHRRAS